MTRIVSIFYILIFSLFSSHSDKDFVFKYIDTYASVAIQEMERTNIPASIKLAQGMLESNWGRSELASKANNHFGIKCGSKWNGPTYYRFDDDYNKKGDKIQSCFRAFDSEYQSFIAHSEFLTDPKKDHRYGFLFDLPKGDYKSWAYGLKRSGYATDNKYPQKLIQIIEQYELYVFDQRNSGDNAIASNNIEDPNQIDIEISRETEMIIEKEEKPVSSPSIFSRTKKKVRTPKSDSSSKKQLESKKSNKSTTTVRKQKHGTHHYVKKGESMENIAKTYNVKLTNLYMKNRMPEGSEPHVGEKIQLKGLFRLGKAPKFYSKKELDSGEFVF